MKEYVVHIRDTHEDSKGKTWCGQPVVGFVFQDVDHAAMNGRAQGRLIPCPACRDAVVAALMNGAEDFQKPKTT